ncbi:LysR substrate-binding domain-containing protein [Pukyongiella litopenaei]|uniref:LysR family transcriptional regulator n=1 Tax=Pukyongiella litopenaei TaxID=2605946 RepID=A0A2S0MSE0_9RHOB|nr:LysR substrate-binding domain-containing protein [Pukyongiella litopenaei]AVO38651.2 LysR family transcriptional regulator [Pukyongiella litopenaei]
MKQRQVQAFRAVMQYGSITAAARAIGVTQPAVSRLIADLEHSVSFALFERRGGKLLPTREAMELYGEVERMYYGMERLERVAAEIRQLRRADLRVATMPMVSFRILPAVLSGFVRAFEGVRVTHNVHTSPRVIDLVASRQYELGIAQVQGARQDIEILASFRTHCVCVMVPDHPLAGRSELGPGDLDGVPMVALTRESLASRHVDRAFSDVGAVPDVIIESQPSFAACALSAAGIGVAIVDPLTPISFGDALVRVPFTPVVPFDFHVLKPANQTLSRAGAMFRDRMIATIARMEDVVAI